MKPNKVSVFTRNVFFVELKCGLLPTRTSNKKKKKNVENCSLIILRLIAFFFQTKLSDCVFEVESRLHVCLFCAHSLQFNDNNNIVVNAVVTGLWWRQSDRR